MVLIGWLCCPDSGGSIRWVLANGHPERLDGPCPRCGLPAAGGPPHFLASLEAREPWICKRCAFRARYWRIVPSDSGLQAVCVQCEWPDEAIDVSGYLTNGKLPWSRRA